MPIYTYKCENCHHTFDIFQHFYEDTLTVCPNCKKETLKKIYTPVGIVFKGSGFYATDHKSPSGQIADRHENEEPKKENNETTKEVKETTKNKVNEGPSEKTMSSTSQPAASS